MSLLSPGKKISSLWEVQADGSNLHPVLPGWKTNAMQCCGDWTRDGRYYIFEVQPSAGTIDLWAVRDSPRLFRRDSEPVQLTNGPLWYTDPVTSPEGDRVFANGALLQGELVRYDTQARQFVPYLSGVSAGEADFSPDGQWIVYVSYPDLTLWRSHLDGSQRMQLTFPPITATLPRWSPDGKQIAYIGLEEGKQWKVYLISPDGGSSRELLPQDRQENDVTWSPDAKQVAFARPSYGIDLGELEIQTYDLATRQASTVPGSRGLFSPRWSPDGRHLAALSSDSKKLMLFDFEIRKWTDWLRAEDGTVGYPVWSKDGKSIYIERFYASGAFPAQAHAGRVAIKTVSFLERTVSLRRVVGNLVGRGSRRKRARRARHQFARDLRARSSVALGAAVGHRQMLPTKCSRAGQWQAGQNVFTESGRLIAESGFLASRGQAAVVGDRDAEVFVGIYWGVVDADFVVKVRSGGASAFSHIANHVAAVNRLPGGDGIS